MQESNHQAIEQTGISASVSGSEVSSGCDRGLEVQRDTFDHARAGAPPDDPENEPSIFPLNRNRMVIVLCIILALVLMAVIPPLINVSRYRRRIANSIGISLGRPVHIDSVTLTLLPMPGFTLNNFVVQDEPTFGAEPVIRAQQVRATLRMGSLWRRRVEFSRIVLDDPSVNLVHLADGRWNLESILLQASRMPAAPTQQKDAGYAPRFPYIEASGARVNIKMGLEKMPISITDADFALWLPEPHQWHLRLKAIPSRTDAAATDAGLLRVEGTLGQAETLGQVPVRLIGRWTAAPFGAVSRIVFGRDAGIRGEMTLTMDLQGTLAANQLSSRLEVRELRRADFVPELPLNADISCSAGINHLFHALSRVHCSWPASGPDSSPSAKDQTTGLEITGDIQDIFDPASADLQLQLTQLPASAALSLARVLSRRVPTNVKLAGSLSGHLACCAPAPQPPLPVLTPRRLATAEPRAPVGPLFGGFTVNRAQVIGLSGPPLFDPENGVTIVGSVLGNQLVVKPVSLALGSKDPAILEFRANLSGYSIHLSGSLLPSRWNQLVRELPPLGDGVNSVLTSTKSANVAPEAPLRVDVTSYRTWAAGPVPDNKPKLTLPGNWSKP